MPAPDECETVPRHLRTPAILAAAALILLHVAGAFFAPSRLWGVCAPRFLPLIAEVLLFALAVLLVVPAIATRVAKGASRGWSWVEAADGRQALLRTAAVSAGAMVLFILARSHNYFLGDGWFRVNEMAGGKVDYGNAGALDLAVHDAAWRLLRLLGARDPAMPYWLVSALAGALWIAMLPRIARRLISAPADRWMVPALLLTLGSVQLFFGYVECYTLREAAILAYLLLSLDALAGGSPVPATVMLAVAGAFHLSALSFGPSLVPLWVRRGSRGELDRRRLLLGTMLASVIVLTGVLVLFRYLGHYGGTRALLPLRPGPGEVYGLFSPAHLEDMANLLLLVAPGGVLLLIMGAAAWLAHRQAGMRASLRKRGTIFWLLAILSPLGFVFVLDPKLGCTDWDLLAFPAASLTLGALVFWLGRLDARHRAAHAAGTGAAILLGACLLHAASWVGVNHDFRRSAAMVRAMVDDDPHYAAGSMPRFYSMGKLYLDQGLTGDAIGLMERALAARPDDEPVQIAVRLALGKLYAAAGRSQDALESFRRAGEINPELADPHTEMGVLYRKLGNLDESARELQRAETLAPEDGTVHLELGATYQQQGRFEEGNRELERAETMLPPGAAVEWPLAWGYGQAGDWMKAREHAERTLALDPSEIRAHLLLSEVWYRQGDRKRAAEELRIVVARSPDSTLVKRARDFLTTLEGPGGSAPPP